MLDFLCQYLRRYAIPKTEAHRRAAEIVGLICLALLGDFESKMTPGEVQMLQSRTPEDRLAAGLLILRDKYQHDEWEQLLDARITPLLNSYFREVLEIAV